MSAPRTSAYPTADYIVVERLPAGASILVGEQRVHLCDDEIDALVDQLTAGRTPPRGGRRPRRGTGAAAVADLVDDGFLNPGEVLTMRTGGRTHTAEVLVDGRLAVAGHIKESPTEAASFVALARRSGWRAWTNAAGETLEAIRWRWRASELFESDDKELVEEWVGFCVRRRLSPGTVNQLQFEAFASHMDSAREPQALAAIVEWAVWCRQRKFVREEQPLLRPPISVSA